MDTKFKSIAASGNFLVPASGNSEFKHTLCGSEAIEGATSPNSGRPLLLVATLRVDDSRLNLPPLRVPYLHLLYSWTCSMRDGLIVYQQLPSGVRLLRYTPGVESADFPYVGYPSAFPATPLTPKPVTEDEQAVIARLNRREGEPIELEDAFPELAVPRHQVGGEPRMMQWPVSVPECLACGSTMGLLASIGNDNGYPGGFSGNTYTQMIFWLCSKCLVIAAEHQTD